LLSPQYHQLFHEQSLIGWDQIIQGRFASQWTILQHYINPKVPKTWISYTIRTIWYYVYDIWKLRCNTNQGTTPQDKRQRALLRLTPKLITLYSKKNEIDPVDHHIFEKTQEEMLLLPTHIIEKWIYKAHIRISDSIKRQKQKTRQTIQPIQNFFYRVIPAQRQQPQPIPIVRPELHHDQSTDNAIIKQQHLAISFKYNRLLPLTDKFIYHIMTTDHRSLKVTTHYIHNPASI
jgi:hypothetical protein